MKLFFDYIFLTILPFWHELFSLISSLAWPLAIVSVALVFRHQLAALFARLNSLSVAGAEASFSLQQIPSSLTDLSAEKLPDLKGIEITDAVASVEKNLRISLESVDPAEQKDRAIRELAIARLDTAFAITYAEIFGSQTFLLRRFRESGPLPMRDVNEFFRNLQEQFEFHQRHTVEEYLHFLFSKELIEKSDEKIKLTKFGHDYLLFLHRFNLTDRAL